MNSQILHAKVGDKGDFWLLDDDPSVLAAFGRVLTHIREITVDELNDGWRNVDGYRLLLIDSVVRFGFRGTPEAEAWLRDQKITSDTGNNGVVVLYSGAPKTGPWERSYAKSENPAGDLVALVTLFRRTIGGSLGWSGWPQKLSSTDVLSSAIHALENLAVPILIDVGGLAAVVAGEQRWTAEILQEIHDLYFDAEGKPGYLTAVGSLSASSGVAEQIAKLLAPVAGLKGAQKWSAVRNFYIKDKLDATKVAASMPLPNAQAVGRVRQAIDKARNADRFDEIAFDKATRMAAEQLRASLVPIAKEIRRLAAKLRHVRDVKEKAEGKDR